MTNADNSTQAEIVPTEDFKAATTLRRQNGIFSLRDGQEMTMSNEFVIATLCPSGKLEYALQDQRIFDLKLERDQVAVIKDSSNNPILAIERIFLSEKEFGQDRTRYAVWSNKPLECGLN